MKALSERPTKFYGEIFDFTAKRLRAQAEFIQGLADCGNPADLLKRQVEFIESSWKTYSEEASRIWGAALGDISVTRPRR